MNTSSTYQNGTLTILPQGRVDSSEAGKFQQDVNAILDSQTEAIDELIVDAGKLEFISSMGLRVLLQLRRKYKEMRITNCSEAVFNVFKMTGFTSIINIERALAEISADGLTPLPGHQDLYELTDETMLKVFPEAATKEDVDKIVKITKRAFIMEVPTPITFEIKTVGDRTALIYERIKDLDIDAQTLGRLMRELHEHIVEPNGIFPSATARLREQIQRLNPYLGDVNTAKLKQMLSAMPDGSCLLHGNMSLEKIASCNGEPVIMDLGEMCYGNAMIDLAHLYAMLPEDKKGDFFDEFIHAYYDIESDETIRRNKQNIVTFAVIMGFTSLIASGEPTADAVKASREDFDERITSRWEEILSGLRFKMDFNEEIRKLERQRFYTDSDVNIDWVAEKLGTNRHYVSDFFNKVLHTTFTDYINTLRLKYAVDLIRSKKIPASQIAYSVGYNNDHTFRRIFKDRYKCTPSQFTTVYPE